MTLSALQQRFETVSMSLSAQDWTLLGALASEHALTQAVLEQLCPAPALPAAAWLRRARTESWVISSPVPRSGSLKPHYSVHPDFEQLVLRRLATSGELDGIVQATHRLLTLRSVSDLTLLLQNGSLAEFQRRYAARKRPPEVGPVTRAEWLRRSICEPFDPEWLLRAWGGNALRVALLVLEESLARPAACDELYAWLERRGEDLGPAEADSGLGSALFQQAFFRSRAPGAERWLGSLPHELRLWFSAALCYAAGDQAQAQAGLDRALAEPRARKRDSLPDTGALAPLFALLLLSRDNDAGRAAAKRILSAGSGEVNRGAQRALRTLLRHLSEPSTEQRRLDVHQLSTEIGAWELSILALTVHLHSADPWARANWCHELVRRARDIHDAGYVWVSRQALFLARMLNEQHFTEELRRLELSSVPTPAARELVVWDLIAPKPQWQKALDVLAQIASSEPSRPALSYRVAWYVDLVHGALRRPGLQECRASEGWTEGRRISLAELWSFYSELPNEDRVVLDCTREEANGVREFTPEAAEALIGHPRVKNGLAARAPVQVLRATPRIETREERGYVQVFVEPPGATLGVNLVPDGESCLLVYRVTEALHRASEALRHGARVPKSHERELIAVLGKLAENVEVRSPELGSERTVPADPTPCLRFSMHAGAWLVQLGVRPFSEQGRFFLAGIGRTRLNLYRDGQRLRCERELELELERSLALRSACPTLKDPPPDEVSPFDTPDSWTLGELGVLELLSELRAGGVQCALEWPESGGLRLSGKLGSQSLKGRLRSDKGWYLVTGGVHLDAITELSLGELLRSPALAQGRFVRLPNGDFVEVEARIRAVLAALKAVVSKSQAGGELRVAKSALYALSQHDLREMGFELDLESRDWLERVAQVREQEFRVPARLETTLRPYQVEGYRWLSSLSALGIGACLADDMGLGKTIQILALLLARAEQAQGPALVIAPTSVCGNWLAETTRFAPTLRAFEYVGKERARLLADLPGPSLLICSYTLLQQDQAELSRIAWGTVVLDEAQFIKNPQSLRAKAAYGLPAKQCIAATGTPVENHLGDLWGIFRFLNPGLLGDWLHFKHTFLMPVQRDAGRESTELLHRLVKPFLLRRLKRDVLADLPPVTDVVHEIHWSEDEALRYALLRKQIHDKLYTAHGKRNNKLEVLAEIMRLRRFCCHPVLVFPDAPRQTSKIDVFLQLVEELRENQHRALVFSQFVDFLSLLREELDERAIRYEYLDGSTPQAERQARVDSFQEGDLPLFLISLKAGGFGLNLTAADYVIHLDPWWNPAVQAQATDRAHRIGQLRPVTVYRLITKNSIEERIVQLHTSKQQLAGALLDASDSVAGLSADELLTLVFASVSEAS